MSKSIDGGIGNGWRALGAFVRGGNDEWVLSIHTHDGDAADCIRTGTYNTRD